jgi:hypothetical protein
MRIIEHRGGWCAGPSEFKFKKLQNTLEAFSISFERKNGAEIDIRDAKNKLIISHDIPNGGEVELTKVLDKYIGDRNFGKTLALNIKCDGLQQSIKSILNKYNLEDYFVFDMSIPEALKFLDAGIKYYLRDSEYENPRMNQSDLYKNSIGIWMDQFHPGSPSRISYELMKVYLSDAKELCIVSPELHLWGTQQSKTHLDCWEYYRESLRKLSAENYVLNKISICTDYPGNAMVYFKEFMGD